MCGPFRSVAGQFATQLRVLRGVQLDNEGGSVQLKASQAEGAKLVGMWSVTGVKSINDRLNKQPNRIDVTTSSGTVALSAATLEDKRAWLHALRDALGQT